MTDPVPDSKPSTRWFWTIAIVLLAVAAVIFFLNADGDEDIETIPDSAITTTEERLNTDIVPTDESELPPINGAEGDAMETDAMEAEPVETE